MTNNFGAIGGLASAPDSTTVGVSHAYSGVLGGTVYNLRVALVDSTDGFARDSFGITLLNGSSSVFSLDLTPTVVVPVAPDPMGPDPTGANDGIWTFSYAGGATTDTINQAIIENGFYDLALSFIADGAGGTDFSLTTTGANSAFATGNVAVDPNAAITALGFTWSTSFVDPANAGDNYLMFDNINIVPEPSAVLLLGLTGLGFVFRRSRA